MDRRNKITKKILVGIILIFSLFTFCLYANPVKDHYNTLGVSQDASQEEIRQAYRSKAQEWHPDRHQGETEKKLADKKFKDINEAKEVLSDLEKRAAYDVSQGIDELQTQKEEYQVERLKIILSMEVGTDLYDRLGLSLNKKVTDKKVEKSFEEIKSQIVKEIIHEVNKIPDQQRRSETDILEQKRLLEKFSRVYEAYVFLSKSENRKNYNEYLKGHSKKFTVQATEFILENGNRFIEIDNHLLEETREGLKPSISLPGIRSFSDYLRDVKIEGKTGKILRGAGKIFGTKHVDLYTQIEYLILKESKISSSEVQKKEILPLSSYANKNETPPPKSSNTKKLASFSPDRIETIIQNELYNSQPNSPAQYSLKATVQRFPREALMFYAAIGATMLTKDIFWNGLFNDGSSADPDWMPAFVEQFTSPIGIFSFFSFVYVAGKMNSGVEKAFNGLIQWENKRNQAIRNGKKFSAFKRAKRDIKTLGIALRGAKMPLALSAGMFVSNIVHEISADENLKSCSSYLFKSNKPEEYLENCQSAYSIWTDKIGEWAPSAYGLVGSAATAGVITSSLTATGRSLKNITNSKIQTRTPNWRILGKLGSFVGKSNLFTSIGVGFFHLLVFFEVNTYLFEPHVVKPLQIKNLAQDIDDLESKIEHAIINFEDGASDKKSCNPDFNGESALGSLSIIWKNRIPNKKDCPVSYIDLLHRKYIYKLNLWRSKQSSEFYSAHYYWKRSVDEAQFEYQYVSEVLRNFNLSKKQGEKNGLQLQQNLRYHDVNIENIEKAMDPMDRFLEGEGCTLNSMDQEKGYTCNSEDNNLKRLSEIRYLLNSAPKNKEFSPQSCDDLYSCEQNSELCELEKYLCNVDQFFKKNGYTHKMCDLSYTILCTVDPESCHIKESCYERATEQQNQNKKVSDGIQKINQWISEDFKSNERTHENEMFILENPELVGYNELRPYPLTFSSTSFDDVANVLLLSRDELKTSGEKPMAYSLPIFFVDLNNEFKEKVREKKDENTWSHNLLFSDLEPHLESNIVQMVCGNDIKDDMDDSNLECPHPENISDLVEKLPSFDKRVAGPYSFNTPRLVGDNFPEDIKNEICDNKNSKKEVFYKKYNVNGKQYENLLFLVYDYYDSDKAEQMGKQHKILMDCFNDAYKNMYKKKLTPVITNKEAYSYISNSRTNPISIKLPKGTFESIKKQIEYYLNLLISLDWIQDDSLELKEDIFTLMNNYSLKCLSKESEDDVKMKCLPEDSEPSEAFSLSDDVTKKFKDYYHNEHKTPNPEFLIDVRNNVFGTKTVKDLNLNNKDKLSLSIIHNIIDLQRGIEQIYREKTIIDKMLSR